MIFKDGVRITVPLHFRLVDAMAEIARVYYGHEEPFVITSIGDGEHMDGSLHYEGRAFDFRKAVHSSCCINRQFLHELLGSDFDLVEEETHFHVEYDPKP